LAKKLTIIGASILGLLIVAALALVFLVDANQFRPALEETMSKALGRRVTISNITVAPFSGGIAIEGLAIADDAAFAATVHHGQRRAGGCGPDAAVCPASACNRSPPASEVRLLRSTSGWNASCARRRSSSSGGAAPPRP
jgi:hypothetical protein